MPALFVVGGGGLSRVVIEAARSQDFDEIGFVELQPCKETVRRLDVPRLGNDDYFARYSESLPGSVSEMLISMIRVSVLLSCSILAGCIGSAPHMLTPIARWEGKNSVNAAVDCVTKALDYNFGSPRPPLPGVTHRAKAVEEGRVYDIAPETLLGDPLYFVRVRSEGSQKTIIELYILPIKYEAPLRDALAKCV
jgi:hypothetical protein